MIKTLMIDFLYLDLHTCKRCVATDGTLKEALEALSDVLDALNYEVKVNKVEIATRELAKQYRFVSSPTIRVNGFDIGGEIQGNNCCSCGTICGDMVDCRTFTYDDASHEQPPKAMLIDGILRVLYGNPMPDQTPYVLPINLERFFAGLEEGNSAKNRKKVVFICVHNSCRSQIAEALGKLVAGDVLECYSAGTKLKDLINADAVRLMKELYSVDMEKTQQPKLLDDIPPVDIVVTMGCNVECPFLPCKERIDWGLPDPTGQSDDAFKEVISCIETNVRALAEKVCFE